MELTLKQHARGFLATALRLVVIVTLATTLGCGDSDPAGEASATSGVDRGRDASRTLDGGQDAAEDTSDEDDTDPSDQETDSPDQTIGPDATPDETADLDSPDEPTPDGDGAEEEVVEVCDDCGPMVSPWPMYGHDAQNTGRTEAVFGETYERLFAIEDISRWGYSGTVITSDGAVVGGADGSPNEEMAYAYSATYSDGDDPIFSFDTDDFFDTTDVFGFDTTPVLGIDGIGYMFAKSGYLVTIDAEDGLAAFRMNISSVNEWAGSPRRSHPTMDADGNIYGVSSYFLRGAQPHLFKVNRTGTVLWSRNLGQDLEGPNGDCAPALTHDGLVVVRNTRVVVAFDGNTGEVVHSLPSYWVPPPDNDEPWYGSGGWPAWLNDWYDEFDGPAPRFQENPAIDEDGSVYISSDKGLFGLRSDLTVKWHNESLPEGSTPAIGTEHLYVVSLGKLYALNKQTGEIAWFFPDDDDEADTDEGDIVGRINARSQPAIDACGNVAVLTGSDNGDRLLIFRNGIEEELVFATTPGDIDLNDARTMSVDDDGRIFFRGGLFYGYGPTTSMSCVE